MRLAILFLILITALLGQTPDEQVLVEQLDTYETPHDGVMAQYPEAQEVERTENHLAYRLTGKQRMSIFRRGLSYVDEQGQIQRSAPKFWKTRRGWMVRQGPALVVVAKPPTGNNYWLGIFQRNVGDRKGFAIRLGETVTRVGRAVQFDNGGLSWTASIWGRGFAMKSETINASRGQVIHSWPYRTFGDVTVSVAAAGHLIVGNKLRITRAVMLGADHQKYPCSKWNIRGDQVGFACDDTSLPPEAYPYLIDPTGNYYQDISTDDGYTEQSGCTSYYSSSGCSASSSVAGSSISMHNSLDLGNYKITQAFFLFDTSALPDNAVISYTQLVIYGSSGYQTDFRYHYVVDVYDDSNWPITSADFVWNPEDSDRTDESIFKPGADWKYLTEAGADSQVDKTGDTGVVMAPYDGNPNPTGVNVINVYTQESSYDPYFRVVYTLPGGPMLIMANE